MEISRVGALLPADAFVRFGPFNRSSEERMKLEVLGSGGAVSTPKPFCACATCAEARKGGPKDSRYGPSVFIHGPDVLIDTPEEIFVQLNRSNIRGIAACLYSHWHPDHTSGRRIFEMNKDWINYPATNKATRIIVTEKIAETFSNSLGLKGHFDFLASMGLVAMETIGNSEACEVNGYRITPIQLGQDYSFGYDISGGGKRILVVMDELKFWKPGKAVIDTSYDLVYLPLGIVDVNPITNERTIDPNHSILEDEQTWQETLEYAKALNAKRFVLGHVEEPDGIGYGMGERLGAHCSRITGKEITIAYDTMECEI
jgi:phosphoribosyl 1,2-cyclic phosphate phosphodiesterase